MSASRQVTAIFDIGKTNKKFLLFDESYTVIERDQIELNQALDDDGAPCEDLELLETWIRDQFSRAKHRYPIHTLNFSAYGATLIHLDQNGRAVTPLYNYLKSYPNDLLERFYKSAGGQQQLSLETASPPMGMLNSGFQLYWLKNEKPDLFAKIESSLHFPNYLSYLFSGEKVSELTSIGCHTAMWNFSEMTYHPWLKNEGMGRVLQPPHPVSGSFENEEGITIGPGIHDSSAALTPYLIGLDDPFLLISTGTWSISFNPFNNEPLTYNELEKDCLCYMDIHGNQVKASRFFLGAEYSYQKKKIENFFGKPIDETAMELNASVIHQLVKKESPGLRLELEQAFRSGPFQQAHQGDWKLDMFSSQKEAYHQLVLDLAAIQAESIKLALGSVKLDKFIITGGFSENDFFVSLLASFFPDKHVYTSKLSDASALGAAMVLNENIEDENAGNPPFADFNDSGVITFSQRRKDLSKLLSLKKAKPIEGLQLMNYSWV